MFCFVVVVFFVSPSCRFVDYLTSKYIFAEMQVTSFVSFLFFCFFVFFLNILQGGDQSRIQGGRNVVRQQRRRLHALLRPTIRHPVQLFASTPLNEKKKNIVVVAQYFFIFLSFCRWTTTTKKKKKFNRKKIVCNLFVCVISCFRPVDRVRRPQQQQQQQQSRLKNSISFFVVSGGFSRQNDWTIKKKVVVLLIADSWKRTCPLTCMRHLRAFHFFFFFFLINLVIFRKIWISLIWSRCIYYYYSFGIVKRCFRLFSLFFFFFFLFGLKMLNDVLYYVCFAAMCSPVFILFIIFLMSFLSTWFFHSILLPFYRPFFYFLSITTWCSLFVSLTRRYYRSTWTTATWKNARKDEDEDTSFSLLSATPEW